MIKGIASIWWLVCAIAALASGIVLELFGGSQPAVRQTALLLIVYSLIVIWLRIQPIIRLWQARIVRALRLRRRFVVRVK